MGKKHIYENPGKFTFSKIASTLSMDYESIFVISAEDDSYAEYSISGSDNELVVRSSGDDFYADLVEITKERVYQDDQEQVLNLFEKRGLLKKLKKESSVFLNYRLLVKGVPRHYSLKAMLAPDGIILIGVLSIEDTIIRMKEKEAGQKTYAEMAGSLASLYDVIYHVDINTGHYKEYSSSSTFSELGLKTDGEDFFGQMRKYAEKIVSPDDFDKVMNVMDRDNLARRLKEDPYVSLIFRQMLDGRMQYVSLIAFLQKGNLDRLVVGIIKINDRRMAEITGDIHSEIAGALAGRCEIIYYIDAQTNEYIQYNGGEGINILENGRVHEDFFADVKKEISEDIIPDDREMMLAELEKETLTANLDRYGARTVTYRKIKGKKTRYKVLLAVYAGNDRRHIVIAVGVVHAGKKNDRGSGVAAGSAIDVTAKDELTNVRNKSAYVYLEEELDRQMSSVDKPEFSIVICDVNDLKIINETRGHKAGDESIRDACEMICAIFDHSPVFRIGGDEFVVVLRDQDYEKRESLISNLLYEREKNRKSSGVTIAYGISDYDPEKDLRVADVFKR
ncbi:MAG: diguanylate cyclase, partial [Lachnospiraceae bacterium]|nr:diguanylate cyclase [Lachnospiraceae bacterium]